jgi:hypothetical protein
MKKKGEVKRVEGREKGRTREKRDEMKKEEGTETMRNEERQS